MKQIDLSIPKGAIFSEDRKYRYCLWRYTNGMTVFENNTKIRLQIGLNPSTANEFINDATIERSVRRADMDGFGIFVQANLYAYSSSNPKVLLEIGDFVGLENDDYLRKLIKLTMESEGQVVVGWGSFKPVIKRAPEVLKMIPEPYCLGINADGQPKHPLYIGYETPMIRYEVKRNEVIDT